jgi:predicted ATPase
MGEALALARSLAHPFNVAYACHFAAGLHHVRRERDAVQQLEDESIALSNEHGFRLFLIAGGIHQGWALSEQAPGDAGIARIREGLAAWRAIGAELRMPAFAALLAEACGKARRWSEGLAAVSDGLAVGAQTGQHYWDAELHRLRGALALRRDPGRGRGIAPSDDQAPGAPPESAERDAEAALEEAVAIARRQGAKWLELRAVTALCRLWAGQGRTSQAHGWLAAVHDWFTEGFDTADLGEARSLLRDLARREDRPAGASPRGSGQPSGEGHEAHATWRSRGGPDRPG